MRHDRQHLLECDGARRSGPERQKEHGRQTKREQRAARKGGDRGIAGAIAAGLRQSGVLRVSQAVGRRPSAVRSH